MLRKEQRKSPSCTEYAVMAVLLESLQLARRHLYHSSVVGACVGSRIVVHHVSAASSNHGEFYSEQPGQRTSCGERSDKWTIVGEMLRWRTWRRELPSRQRGECIFNSAHHALLPAGDPGRRPRVGIPRQRAPRDATFAAEGGGCAWSAVQRIPGAVSEEAIC